MHPKVVLLDLENNFPTAKLLREIVTHYSSLYLFNCAGTFEFSLEDLTELAGWIASGQIIILDTPESPQKEYEYAVIVGQLMALLEPETEVELISAMDSSEMLQQMLQASDIKCSLIQIQPDEVSIPAEHVKNYLPSLEAIRNKPALQLVKKYCDALGKMSGKPNTLETLKNSVANILHVMPVKAQHVVGMLINLKIVKRYDEQISFRKKVLKQWLQLNLDEQDPLENPKLDQVMSRLKVDDAPVEALQTPIQSAQQDLFKNFNRIDPVQLEVARKLRELQGDKPKDIYELRDLLEQLFPQSDIRLLLKELIEKGYIYWNGHEVLYSHEMFLN
ncbi:MULTISPECIES: hypothetical protein [Acinetobacter]|uniref:PIN-like domain-containing protein n=1 Tax=Acinetobacter pseudolwoffii TaxID=2053287 RepID=N9M489_9GAMM|nr:MULTISPECIES: hypothetical protein [Acinetobacter]ENW85496.1 hypothetical protein F906_02307 [Acinetobacter pseudolwoffii]MCP0911578.1 hypothetical protein [Acinetobacter pseudolwoffii]MDM1322797.1 hypothetical protein [Acinetobacter pseudolwoffii]MDM1341385.1 hypothetical protein [Acinetobacter pseudolwoffii]PJI35385.1 hypothetical protein CU318_07495 [Acinetobacter pseudolwoffii]